jgi:hypothetical protein
MATLYLDTEFNGFGGPLISMAIVSDDGREFYEVVEFEGVIDPWVHQNVIPKLGRLAVPVPVFKTALHAFLRQFRDPLIVCDWHGDLMHFAASLGGPSPGTSLNYRCRTLLLDGGPSDWPNPMPHNALCDARALRDWHMRAEAA